MSGFGKRPASAAPTRSPVAASAGGDPSLPLSIEGLLGAVVITGLMALLFVNSALFKLQALTAANPELVEGISPDEISFVTQSMPWLAFTFFGAKALGYCFLAHRAARFFKSGEFWLFALVGLLAAALLCLSSGLLPGPIRGAAFPLFHGVAATSAYWLIAKWRAA